MVATGTITFLVTTVIGAVFKLIAAKQAYKTQEEQAKLAALNAKAQITKEAREYENSGFQITRRVIALSATFAIVVMPLIFPMLYAMVSPYNALDPELNPSITFCYDVVKSGFWPFTSDSTKTVCDTFQNSIVVGQYHTELMSAIAGLYFGAHLGKAK